MVGGSIFPVQKHSPPTIRPVPLGARANLRASHGNNKLELRVMTISRSENMRRIQGKDTKPEMVVRSLLRSLGYPGYRMLMLVSAKGRRAAQIKSQLMALEQKLTALNLELEKKKLQSQDTPKPSTV